MSPPHPRLWPSLLTNVKNRAVCIYIRQRRLGAPVSHEVLRRNNPLLDPVGCPWPMTADAEDALAPVRVVDPQNRMPVGPLVWVADKVNSSRELKIGEFPTRKFGHLVGAASGGHVPLKGLPGPAACDSARRPTARRRDEGPETRELDLSHSVSLREYPVVVCLCMIFLLLRCGVQVTSLPPSSGPALPQCSDIQGTPPPFSPASSALIMTKAA